MRAEIVLTGKHPKADGTRRVDAEIVGPFGVHRCGWGFSSGWIVTHVRTGLKLPAYFETERAAITCAAKLARVRSVTWNIRRPLAKSKERRYQQVLRRAVRGIPGATAY